MEIITKEEAGRKDIAVTILSAPADERVPRLVERLQTLDNKLVGYPTNGSAGRQILTIGRIVFIDTINKCAYIHMTSGEVHESPLRLFELEEKLKGTEFVRISRQALLNFDYVTGIRPESNGRLVLEVADGSAMLASRGYASNIKRKIGSMR